MTGERLLEKTYGRDRCLSKSMIHCGPVVYPPEAPPIVCMSVVCY